MDVAKKLSFEDLSTTLTESLARLKQQQAKERDAVVTVDQNQDFAAHLTALASSLEQLYSKVEAKVAANRASVLHSLNTTGGRQALESDLKSQKAQWKFQGQKEAFLDYISNFSDPAQLLAHNFQSDILVAEDALKAVKDELKERQADIQKAETALEGLVAQVARVYEQGQALAAQEARELPELAEELQGLLADRPPPLETLPPGTLNEVQLAALLAQEDARAAALEQELAQERAAWADEEATCFALQQRVTALEAQVADAQESASSRARQDSQRYEEQAQWFDAFLDVVALLHGVRFVSHDDSVVTLQISQAVPASPSLADPAGMPLPGSAAALAAAAAGGTLQDHGASTSTAAGAGGVDAGGRQALQAGVGPQVQAEHLLVLQLYPGSSVLRGAELSPPSVDISEEVKVAQDMEREGLAWLVARVKRRLRLHARRQALLQAAAQRYPLREVGTDDAGGGGGGLDSSGGSGQGVLRVALPLQSRAELELRVPQGWPDLPGAFIELMDLQAPSTSVDLRQELRMLQERMPQLRGKSLEVVLDWVVVALQAQAQERR